MEIGETLYLTDRKKWRAWLEKHFDNAREIWLIYPHKDSGKPRIPYNDAVEEALCFGWIDSTVKSYGKESSAQRFSPRKSNNSFSQQNKERLKWLLEHGMLHPSVKEKAQQIAKEKFVFPKDIIDELKADKTVWANYQNFSESYQRIRVAYIDDARSRPDEFQKRLENFIKKTRENKMIGFGGIDKYY